MKAKVSFWNGYWQNADGTRNGDRVKRAEYKEAWRLWYKHKDIRTGKYAPQ